MPGSIIFGEELNEQILILCLKYIRVNVCKSHLTIFKQIITNEHSRKTLPDSMVGR